jgi:hypothetical protein
MEIIPLTIILGTLIVLYHFTSHKINFCDKELASVFYKKVKKDQKTSLVEHLDRAALPTYRYK